MTVKQVEKSYALLVDCEAKLRPLLELYVESSKRTRLIEERQEDLLFIWQAHVVDIGKALLEAMHESGPNCEEGFSVRGYPFGNNRARQYMACAKHPEAFEFAWDLDQWVDESDEMERSQVLAHYFEDLQQARQADGTLTSVSYIDDAYKDSWDSFRYLDQAIAKLPQLQPLKKCWQTLASAIRKGKVPSPRSGVSGADGESVKLEPGNVQFGDQT